MYISDFFYIWKTNRMTLFCNLFMERPSYWLCLFSDRSRRLSGRNGYNVSASSSTAPHSAGTGNDGSGTGGGSVGSGDGVLLSFHQLHRGSEMEAALNSALVYCNSCSTSSTTTALDTCYCSTSLTYTILYHLSKSFCHNFDAYRSIFELFYWQYIVKYCAAATDSAAGEVTVYLALHLSTGGLSGLVREMNSPAYAPEQHGMAVFYIDSISTQELISGGLVV